MLLAVSWRLKRRRIRFSADRRMEILVPGLILVALMFWASTKIKKKAAAAYDDETVETDKFIIEKPEGFISPAYPDDGLIFAAYSKEFGRDRTSDLRQAELEVRLLGTATPQQISTGVSTEVAEVPSASGDRAEFVRKVPSSEGMFELRGRVLVDHRQEFVRKLKEMMQSFTVK